jgi:hypothetical protein
MNSLFIGILFSFFVQEANKLSHTSLSISSEPVSHFCSNMSSNSISSISVAVRVRPFNDRESRQSSQCIVGMPSAQQCTLRDPSTASAKDAARSFTFDHAFWTHSSADLPYAGGKFADQKLVYEALGVPILDNAFNGYNSCLFAYGQTGSGKTYTMMGSPASPGVIPQLCHELFQRAGDAAARDASIVTVECSYLEIYNENVRDLLAQGGGDKGSLKVRQHPRRGVYVEGLARFPVSSAEDVLKLLDGGGKIRAVASTNMNAASSRSHAILTLVVKIHRVSGSELVSNLHLVDLAGSERAASTGAEGSTLLEGANINKSLTTLGMVLSKLAEASSSDGKNVFVPFRDSQLTWILNDSLGGNSRTAMLANISPASINYEETLSTLRFAMTVKKVKNHAVVNEDPQQKLIRELREEIEAIRQQMSSAASTAGSSGTEMKSAPDGFVSVGDSSVEAMQQALAERIAEMQHLEEEQKETEELVRTLREKIKEMDQLKQHLAVTVSEQQRQRFATAFRSAFLLSREKSSVAGRVVEVKALEKQNAKLLEEILSLRAELSCEQTRALEEKEQITKKHLEEISSVKRHAQQTANDNAAALAAEEVASLRQENVRLRQDISSLRAQLAQAQRQAHQQETHQRTDPTEPLLEEETSAVNGHRSGAAAKQGCPCTVM